MLFWNKLLDYAKQASLVETIQRWEPILPRYLFVAVIVYPFLFIWQGGDFTDTGYHALNIQRFFADVEIGRIYAPAFLTYLIGGLWWDYFSWLGLIGLRILVCVFIVGSAVGTIYLLKDYGPKTIVYLSVLAAEAYCIRFVTLSFSYDFVSLFFLLWATVIILISIEKRKVTLAALSGVLIACATLARLPSVIGVILAIIPFFDFLVHSNGISQESVCRRLIDYPVKYAMFFCFGFFGTLVIIAVSLYAAGLLDSYIAGITQLQQSLGSGQGYGKSVLLIKYLIDLKHTVFWGGLALLWIIAAGNMFAVNTRALVKVIFLSLTIIFLVLWILKDPTYASNLKFLGLAVYAGMSVLIITGSINTSNFLRNAAMAGLILSIITFIGSNTGLLKTAYGMLLLIPVCTISLWHQRTTQVLGLRMPVQAISFTITCLLLIASISTQFTFVYQVSSGITARLKAHHKFDSPLLQGIYTTKDRADFINQVLPEIQRRIVGGTIYVFGHMPILYFLSQTHPFISKIWLNGNKYSSEFIYEALEEEAKKSPLPLLIITDKMILGETGWELMTGFLNKHKYKMVFSANVGSFKCEIWHSFDANQ
jgi:hypothetical protein